MSEPLTVLMASGPMPPEEVVRIGRELCSGLTSVHGELWPSSIAVAEGGVSVLPPASTDLSRYGMYAAPERILGKPVTPASDVFSVGAILFHALAGRPPFRGGTPAESMLAACTEPPLDLSPAVPRKLVDVIQKCLMKDPAQRYATPAELGEALAKSLGSFEGKRILVADDEASIRDMYARMASNIGVEADLVASGRDAIEALKSRSYDVALLDLNMPRLSGWEVLDFLRTRGERRPRYLYIVTGFGDQMVSEADRELVAAVIYKPIATKQLRALITESLRGDTTPDFPRILEGTRHRIINSAA